MTSSLSARVSADKQRAENFPVALIVLPPALRRDLSAVYRVVRTIDDLGDQAAGDRVALLTTFRAELGSVWQRGRPDEPALRALAPVVSSRLLSREPFDDLVEANLRDQTVTRYDTFDDLIGYCQLSAAPIGRMVLEVFGQDSSANRALSDRVCNALQLLEHWQDVAEDYRAGRVYLPQQDMRRFKVVDRDLGSRHTPTTLRGLIEFETNRAGELLESGAPLVSRLRGWGRVAVAGYVAGGRATVEALHRAAGDVLPGPPRPRKTATVRHLAAQLRGGSR